jgi:hypothetical protein
MREGEEIQILGSTASVIMDVRCSLERALSANLSTTVMLSVP